MRSPQLFWLWAFLFQKQKIQQRGRGKGGVLRTFGPKMRTGLKVLILKATLMTSVFILTRLYNKGGW